MNSSALPLWRPRSLAIACVIAFLLAIGAAVLPTDAYAADKPLPAPTHVKAKATKKCTVKISWKRVPDADGYMIYRSTHKNKGYKSLGALPAAGLPTEGSISVTDPSTAAGQTYYYKVSAYRANNADPSIDNGRSSKPAKAKASSTFKNSYVKFTIPKLWRGKVYVFEDPGNRNFKSLEIRENKTGEPLATFYWHNSKTHFDGGDPCGFPVNRWKRGKGWVELWITSWPQVLYHAKYLTSGSSVVTGSTGAELSKSKTNRLIKLQTGGKYTYNKIKRVKGDKHKSSKYSYDAYIKKNLKVKIVK